MKVEVANPHWLGLETDFFCPACKANLKDGDEENDTDQSIKANCPCCGTEIKIERRVRTTYRAFLAVPDIKVE